jgi:15-cis-phytoene synthase
MSIHFERVFKRSSTTYYYSSLFFPKETKKDVFALYAYVRTADDFVDSIPQDIEGFMQYKKETIDAIRGENANNSIISAFIELSARRSFRSEWIISFLSAMESDITKKEFATYNELEEYVHGSAEVIGLMMCAIMGVREEYHDGARKLGASMQLINFIRDIEEDNSMGRTYIPEESYSKHGLKSLRIEEAQRNKEGFSNAIRKEIISYRLLRSEAHKSLKGIRYRQRVPIKTASDLYNWTANVIYSNPMIVYERKVKPTKARVTMYIIKNAIYPW